MSAESITPPFEIMSTAQSAPPTPDTTKRPAENHRPGLFAAISARKAKFLHQYELAFLRLGGFIFDHAYWFIAISTVVVLVCSISFLFIHFETRADLLYALPASQARSDLAKLSSLYGSPARVNMVFVVSRNNESVLTRPTLRKLANLDNYIKHHLQSAPLRRMKSEVAPPTFVYEDVCHRMRLPAVNFTAVRRIAFGEESAAVPAVEGGEEEDRPACLSMGVIDMYRSERQYGQPLSTRQWPYIPNIAANKIIKADLALTDAQVIKFTSGTTRLLNATGFLFLYYTESGDPSKLAASLEWEEALIHFVNDRVKPYASSDHTDPRVLSRYKEDRAAYHAKHLTLEEMAQIDPTIEIFNDRDWSEFDVIVNAGRSWQDELGRSTSLDKRLMRDYAIAYLIIATYMIVVNHTNNLVRSKSICGFIGSLSALFGFGFGGGVCYWLGLRHTPTMHAAPFLVLAIGLDNTFVVLNFYSLAHSYVKNPRKRCAMALSDAGISITVTTSTSIISFLVGAVGPYLAVRNFCLVTAMGLLGGYLMNIVLFFPFLCLEAVAESEDRVMWFPDWFLALLPTWIMPQKAFLQMVTSAQEDRKTVTNWKTLTVSDDEARSKTVDSDDPVTAATNDPFGVTGEAFHKALSKHLPHRRGALPAPPRPTATARSDIESNLAEEPDHSSAEPELHSQPLIQSSAFGVTVRQSDSSRLAYLRNVIFAGKSIFQLAAIQWQFTRRDREFERELKKRDIAIPRRSEDLNQFLRAVRPSERKQLTDLHAHASDMPNRLLPPATKINQLVCQANAEPDGTVGKYSRGLFLNVIGPLLCRPIVQIFILLGLLFYLAASLYGAIKHLSAGLDLENLTPPDSYLREAFRLSHDKFPIFPYETHLLFTAPDFTRMHGTPEERKALLEAFSSNSYGTRRASDLKPLSLDDVAAHGGSSSGMDNTKEMKRYLQSLGEVPWWRPAAMKALIQVDKNLREMKNTQDVLNGLNLFYNENAAKIFAGETDQERRKLFHVLLYKWLKSGVVGQHVRNQFSFANPDIDDAEGLPKLLGFRLSVFNYNFLNSYEQSQYMIEVRESCRALSTEFDKLDENDRMMSVTVLEKDVDDKGVNGGEEEVEDEEVIGKAFALPRADNPGYATAGLEEIEADEPSYFSAKPFMETFLFFESDITILSATIINMSTAFVAIVLVSSLLMRGVGTAMLVTAVICFVDLGIFGFMGFWKIHLNILSMILLVLSIGFSVDYTVHVVHTYTHCLGKKRRDKTVETLILMCNPVTHGAISTLLGVSPIGFRQEFIMETFFKMTLLVVVFGFLNGVVFLPVILAIKGPVFKSTELQTKLLSDGLERDIQALHQEVGSDKPISSASSHVDFQ